MPAEKVAPHRLSGVLAGMAPEEMSDEQLAQDIMDLAVTPEFPAQTISATALGYRLRPRHMLLEELIRLRKQYGEVPVAAASPENDEFSRPQGMSDQMFWRLCDADLSLPVPLEKADLHRPFVYERRWGVFYAPMGSHQMGMSLLLAWQRGFTRGVECANSMGLSYSSDTADYWLENTPGAAFRSSVRNKILVSRLSNLSIHERRIFGAAGEMLELMA